MPRRIRQPQRVVQGGKLHSLKVKEAATKEQNKPVPVPSTSKQKKTSQPQPAPRSRRSRSETRSSSNPSDDELSTIRERNSSETRYNTRTGGVRALQEIHRLQSTTELLIPKLPFARLIREVLTQYSHRDFRITAESLAAIQEAAEIYMVQVFEDSYRCCLHRDRVTLGVQDMKLALYLRERWCP